MTAMSIPLLPLALALFFLVGLVVGVYAVSLWSKLSRMEGKMDTLRTNCELHHQQNETHFLPRLEHEVEHQGLWEALHHHEHDFKGQVRR
jgi:hypothetical protein